MITIQKEPINMLMWFSTNQKTEFAITIRPFLILIFLSFFCQAKTKTTSSLEQVNKMVSDLLFVLSRPARLLECLEFDPGHFYSQLEMEEVVLNEGHVNIDMGKYIRMKLGIQEEVEEEEEEEEEKPPLRKVSCCVISSNQ